MSIDEHLAAALLAQEAAVRKPYLAPAVVERYMAPLYGIEVVISGPEAGKSRRVRLDPSEDVAGAAARLRLLRWLREPTKRPGGPVA